MRRFIFQWDLNCWRVFIYNPMFNLLNYVFWVKRVVEFSMTSFYHLRLVHHFTYTYTAGVLQKSNANGLLIHHYNMDSNLNTFLYIIILTSIISKFLENKEFKKNRWNVVVLLVPIVYCNRFKLLKYFYSIICLTFPKYLRILNYVWVNLKWHHCVFNITTLHIIF